MLVAWWLLYKPVYHFVSKGYINHREQVLRGLDEKRYPFSASWS